MPWESRRRPQSTCRAWPPDVRRSFTASTCSPEAGRTRLTKETDMSSAQRQRREARNGCGSPGEPASCARRSCFCPPACRRPRNTGRAGGCRRPLSAGHEQRAVPFLLARLEPAFVAAVASTLPAGGRCWRPTRRLADQRAWRHPFHRALTAIPSSSNMRGGPDTETTNVLLTGEVEYLLDGMTNPVVLRATPDPLALRRGHDLRVTSARGAAQPPDGLTPAGTATA